MASPDYERGLAQLIPKFKTKCPICDQQSPVGFLGGQTVKRFYCCECGVEFINKNDVTQEMYLIAECGTVELMPKE